MQRGKGKIVLFKNKQRKTIFPVTRAEGVLIGETTLDKKLMTYDIQINQLKEDIAGFIPITDAEIDDVVNVDEPRIAIL